MRGIPGAGTNATESPLRENNIRIHENSADTDYDDDIDGVPCKKIIFCPISTKS